MSSAGAGGAGTNRLSAKGVGESWMAQKRSIANLFKAFIAAEPTASEITGGKDILNELPEKTVVNRELYERFAYFVVEKYKQRDGSRLASGSAKGYLNEVIQAGADRFKVSGTPESRIFFGCTDKGSNGEPSVWLQGLRRRVHDKLFNYAIEEGSPLDQSPTPITRQDIVKILTAYCKEGSKEAMTRRFALLTLWIAAGRSTETSWASWEKLLWNSEAHCGCLQWPQTKTGKMKVVALLPGFSRFLCWFLGLADYLATRSVFTGNDGDNAFMGWMIPELQLTRSPTTMLTGFLRGVIKSSATAKWQSVAVDLAHVVSAGGVRPGASNALAAQVPSDFATQCTGHDMTGKSAFFEYVDSSVEMAMPGAIVLAGWPAFPWGHNGTGPAAPRLNAITTVPVEQLESLVDRVFNIDDASPPPLQRNGSFRDGVRTALASLIMYYPERHHTGEARHVNVRLLDAVRVSTTVPPCSSPHDVVTSWASHVRAAFTAANHHVAVRAAAPPAAQTADAIRSLATMISSVTSQVAELNKKVHSLSAQLSPQPESARPPVGPQEASPQPQARAGAQAGDVVAASSIDLTMTASQATATASAGGAGAGARGILVPMREVPAKPFASAYDAVDAWMRKKNPNQLATSFDGQEKGRVITTFAWFDAMANDAELATMTSKSSSPAELRRVANTVCHLLVKRWQDAYVEAVGKIPPSLKLNSSTPFQMNCAFLSNRESDLKGKKKKVPSVARGDVQTWRTSHEEFLRAKAERAARAKAAAEAEAAAAPPPAKRTRWW